MITILLLIFMRKNIAHKKSAANCVFANLATIRGWRNLQDVQIYIEKAEQKRLAKDAISLLEREQK